MSGAPTIRMHVAILLLTTLVGVGMTYVLLTGNHMNAVHQPLGETAIRVRVAITTAHLQLEELAAGKPAVTAEMVRDHMATAERLARTMLEGGGDGSPVARLDDPDLRGEIEAVLAHLAEFRALAEQRIAVGGTGEAAWAIDRQAHVAFDALLTELEHVETVLRRSIERELAVFQRTQAALIAGCVFCGATVLLLFRRYDRQLQRHVQAVIAATEQAQKSHDQVTALAEVSPVGIFRTDGAGRCLFVNDRWCRMTGISAAAALDDGWQAALHPNDHEMVIAEWSRCTTAGLPFTSEYRFQRADGQVTWVVGQAVAQKAADGHITGYIGTTTDITHRKRAEQDAMETHRLMAAIFDHTGVLMAHLDPEFNFLMVNRAYAAADGRTPGEFPGNNHFDLYPNPENEAVFRQVVATGVPHVALAKPFEYASAPQRGVSYWDWSLVPIYDTDGVISGLVLTLLDVSERIAAMEARERSEARYRSLFDNAPISLWEEDLSAVKQYLDGLRDAGIDLRAHFAAHPEEVQRCAALVKVVDVNQATVDLYHADSRDRLLAGIGTTFTDDSYRAFREGLIQLAEGHCEVELDATTRTLTDEILHTVVRVFLAAEYVATWERVIVATVDVTDRERAQEEQLRLRRQMAHTQRLESLGVLAGGIAHDFNNLLTSIMGNVTLARAHLDAEAAVGEELQHIEEAGQRAADLCKQMLAYSGKGQLVIRPIDLSDLVGQMTKLLAVSIAKNVTLRYDLRTDLPAIEGDVGQVQQVVMNLVLNGAEAIGDDPGVVTVATGRIHADRAYLKNGVTDNDLPEGDYVYLEVDDTGCGMDSEARERVFEPFFTTKFTGRGLGMSAVLGIVRGHSGAICLTTTPHQGTTFRVLFPMAANNAQAPRPSQRAHDPWRGSGTVLVVEDETEVRQVLARMLQALGFTVTTAQDGLEAVAAAQQCGANYAVVLLDMTMPRMDGIAACRALRGIRPDLKVVLTSGYNEQEAMARFVDQGLSGFLQKPYTLATLQAKMQQVLEGETAIHHASP